MLGPLRRDRTITPTMPSRMTMTTATAAGTSHAGRSASTPPREGGRGTDGLRAGDATGVQLCGPGGSAGRAGAGGEVAKVGAGTTGGGGGGSKVGAGLG